MFDLVPVISPGLLSPPLTAPVARYLTSDTWCNLLVADIIFNEYFNYPTGIVKGKWSFYSKQDILCQNHHLVYSAKTLKKIAKISSEFKLLPLVTSIR